MNIFAILLHQAQKCGVICQKTGAFAAICSMKADKGTLYTVLSDDIQEGIRFQRETEASFYFCQEEKMKQVKYLVMAALCIALGVVLPITLHAIPNAVVFAAHAHSSFALRFGVRPCLRRGLRYSHAPAFEPDY